LVDVPLLDDFIFTEAPGMGVPDLESVIFPEMDD
jgi:hypothetical protein